MMFQIEILSANRRKIKYNKLTFIFKLLIINSFRFQILTEGIYEYGRIFVVDIVLAELCSWQVQVTTTLPKGIFFGIFGQTLPVGTKFQCGIYKVYPITTKEFNIKFWPLD